MLKRSWLRRKLIGHRQRTTPIAESKDFPTTHPAFSPSGCGGLTMPYSRTNSRKKPWLCRPLDRATRTGAALFLLLLLVAAGTVTGPATFADGLAPYGVKAPVVPASKQRSPYPAR